MARLRPHVRIIFMSGYTRDMMQREELSQEGIACLEKPFSGAALAAKVRDVLDAPAVRGDRGSSGVGGAGSGG